MCVYLLWEKDINIIIISEIYIRLTPFPWSKGKLWICNGRSGSGTQVPGPTNDTCSIEPHRFLSPCWKFIMVTMISRWNREEKPCDVASREKDSSVPRVRPCFSGMDARAYRCSTESYDSTENKHVTRICSIHNFGSKIVLQRRGNHCSCSIWFWTP